MNTQIKLTHNGIDYVLEYNRYSIKVLEEAGFVYDEFLAKPTKNIELAFAALFIKNHPKTPQTTIDEIYASCKDKKGLIAAMNTMINESYDSLLAEPEDESGNVTWEVVNLAPKK